MRQPLDPLMKSYGPTDYSARLLDGICRVVPHAPQLTFYSSVDDVLRLSIPSPTEAQFARARELAQQESVEKALWVARALDTGSQGIALFTGLKSAFQLFFAPKGTGFDADPQQAADAALKALGMAWIVHELFPGSLDEKGKAFMSLPAGEAMALYFALMEVALPFTDNVLSAGGSALSQLLGRAGSDHVSRFSQLAGGEAVGRAQALLGTLMGPLEGLTQMAVGHVSPVAKMAQSFMPGLMNTADQVTGAVATATDLLPVWGLLGSRLAAESVAWQVVQGR